MAEDERLSSLKEVPDGHGGRAVQDKARAICASAELSERGEGVRFELEWEGDTVAAFAIRYNGQAYAYVNRCRHIAVELDWTQGKFFDADGEYLICSTHGAIYAPDSGACKGGPCRGAKLIGLDAFEADGKVYINTKG